jgi:hypothetical protein
MKVEYPLLNRFWNQQRSPDPRLLCHSLHRPVTLFGIGRNLTLTGCRMRIVESLNKVLRKVKSSVNMSYIYTATNLNLDEILPHLFTFPYISSAGGFQLSRFSVCRNFTLPAGAFGFLLSTGSRTTTPYFLTSKSCE